MTNTLYLIRGLPGSGKSTLAHRLTPYVYEADQFFVDTVTGVYTFDPAFRSQAHARCQANVDTAMLLEQPVIAVSNTFTQQWEIEPYRKLAATYGYEVVEVTMNGPLRPNVHGVPPETIRRMRERWEP